MEFLCFIRLHIITKQILHNPLIILLKIPLNNPSLPLPAPPAPNPALLQPLIPKPNPPQINPLQTILRFQECKFTSIHMLIFLAYNIIRVIKKY